MQFMNIQKYITSWADTPTIMAMIVACPPASQPVERQPPQCISGKQTSNMHPTVSPTNFQASGKQTRSKQTTCAPPANQPMESTPPLFHHIAKQTKASPKLHPQLVKQWKDKPLLHPQPTSQPASQWKATDNDRQLLTYPSSH